MTVGSQPFNQFCQVAQGSGTISGSNASNVFVQCSSTLFNVGGLISGLEPGDSITLENNGDDILNRAENGVFVFPTPLSNGSSYAVTITASPSDKLCGIARSTGTIEGEDIVDIGVDCLPLMIFRDGFE